MADPVYYYALTLIANDSTIAAYYSVTPTSGIEFSQGSVSILPNGSGAVMINVYPQTLQVQSPAGSINAGATIETSASIIAGRIMVSPPVDVATVVTLYGAGGRELGQAIVDPGAGGTMFEFSVDASNAIPSDDVDRVLGALVPPAKA